MVPSTGERAHDMVGATRLRACRRSAVVDCHDVAPELAVSAGSPELRGQALDAARDEPWPLAAWPDVPTRDRLCRDDRALPGRRGRAGVVQERSGLQAATSSTASHVALPQPAARARRAPGACAPIRCATLDFLTRRCARTTSACARPRIGAGRAGAETSAAAPARRRSKSAAARRACTARRRRSRAARVPCCSLLARGRRAAVAAAGRAAGSTSVSACRSARAPMLRRPASRSRTPTRAATAAAAESLGALEDDQRATPRLLQPVGRG